MDDQDDFTGRVWGLQLVRDAILGQAQRHFSQSHCLPLVQAALAAAPASASSAPKRKRPKA